MKKLLTVAALSLLATASALAFAPAGTGAIELYNFVVNDMLGGPIGTLAGVVAFGFGAYQVIGRSQFALGVPAIIGGVMILKLEDIMTSFGALVG